MNKNEFTYKGICINGFLALLLVLALFAAAIYFFILADKEASMAVWGVLLLAVFALCMNGFIKQEPNEAKVLVFFGKYSGTFDRTGFFWVNPLTRILDSFSSLLLRSLAIMIILSIYCTFTLSPSAACHEYLNILTSLGQ